MAIINVATRAEGNKAYPATANIVQFANGPGAGDYLGVGTVIQANVETFDGDGNSLGIQGLLYTVADTDPGYDEDVGGIRTYDAMKYFCEQIRTGWNPTVSCWATQASQNMAVFNIQPKGSDGAPFPARVSYELVRIRDWVYTPQAPASVGGGRVETEPGIVVEQNSGSAEVPAEVCIGGIFDGGETVSVRVDTDTTDPVTVQVVAGEGDTGSDVAEALCAAIMAAGPYECETQDGCIYITPEPPAMSVSVSAAAIVND